MRLLSLLEFNFETLTAFVLHYTLSGIFCPFLSVLQCSIFSYLVSVNQNVEDWLVLYAVSYKYGRKN